jgi:redox-sensitive bicupin YhaK (pirin superfamily)
MSRTKDLRTLSRRALLVHSAATASFAFSRRTMAAPSIVVPSVRRVERQVLGMPTTDGAGVRLTRVIGQPALASLDPFVMLDRFHSDDPRAYMAGFPDHPHRGFETVTVMLSGYMRHRDSRGNSGLIAGGGAQWMTAGRGIVHSEMPEQDSGLMSGFQLWVNLPASEKMCPQAYQDLAPRQITAEHLGGGGELRIIAGRAGGAAGPVRKRPTDPVLLTLALEDDRPFDLALPSDHNAFAFVYGGEVHIGPDDDATAVPESTLALLGPGNRLRLRARSRRSAVLLAAGRPLREAIVKRGPFVMNTEAEIARAFADYRAGVLDR